MNNWILVTLLLCLPCGIISTGEKPILQYVYEYEAEVYTGWFSKSDVISYFGISGHFLLQSDDNNLMKFLDLKTTTYNGPESDIDIHSTKFDIPDEASSILEPFALTTNDGEHVFVCHGNEDESWSVNMKKAIGSIFAEDIVNFLDDTIPNSTEWNIYGKCDVSFEKEEYETSAIITKNINGCSNDGTYMWSNLLIDPKRTSADKILTRHVSRKYTIVEQDDGDMKLMRVESVANITAQTTPLDRRLQYVIQKQVFTLINSTKTNTPIKMNYKKCSNIFYEPIKNTSSNRETVEKLLEDLEKNVKILEDYINNTHFTNVNSTEFLVLDKILNIVRDLSIIDADFMELLEPLLENPVLFNVIKYLYPYIGTSRTLQNIKRIIEDWRFTNEEIVHILVTLPMYIQDLNEDIIEEAEFLMTMNSTYMIENTAILSFANLVANCYISQNCKENVITKYANMYKLAYQEADNYEKRMTYILGLSNMADGLNADFLLPLVTNTSEKRQLRSLATYVFKNALLKEPDKVYASMWPIAKNYTDDLEVQVAALDLILDMELSSQQLETILKNINQNSYDSQEIHLYKYLYTALSLTPNNTQNLKMPESQNTLFTGVYEIDLTDDDSNFGAKYELRMVSNSNNDVLDTIQFSEKRHSVAFSLEQESVYLKMEGLFDTILEKALNYRVNANESLPDLFKLIRRNHLKVKPFKEMHIDGVLFKNNRAVVALHTEENICLESFREFTNYIAKDKQISFPVWQHIDVPSDLGTTITFSHKVKEYFSFKNERKHERFYPDKNDYLFEFRYDWMTHKELRVYNPLSDLYIGNSDNKVFKFFVALPYILEPIYFKVGWINDNLFVNSVLDLFPASFVSNEEKLRKYCANCTAYYYIKPMAGEKVDIQLREIGTGLHWTEFYSQFNRDLTSSLNILNFSKVPAELVHFISPTYFLFDKWYNMIHLPPVDALSASLINFPLFSEPTKSEIGVSFEGLSFNSIPHIFDGNDVQISLHGSTKMNNDSYLRYSYIQSYIMYQATEAESGKWERTMNITVDNIFDNGERKHICIDTTIRTAAPRREVYSLVVSKLSEAIITYSEGSKDCSTEGITDRYTITASVSDEQIFFANSMHEYFICKKESTELQFTPPTRECRRVSEILSTYRNYEITWNMDDKRENKTKCEKTGNATILFDMDGTYLTISKNGKERFYDLGNYKYFTEILLLKSIDASFYNEDIKRGMRRTCFITSQDIKTFGNGFIVRYEFEVNTKLIAFIEIIDNMRSGLLFTRLDDRYLAFKFWNQDHIITGSRSNNKLRARISGRMIKSNETIQRDSMTIMNMKNEAIYIYDDIISVYYNTEYIMINIDSTYNNYVTGYCA